MILSQGYPSSIVGDSYPYPLRPSQIGVDLSGVHPKPSQQGPVHARFSRGWVEIGVDLRGYASIGAELTSLRFRAMSCDDGDSVPLPLAAN